MPRVREYGSIGGMLRGMQGKGPRKVAQPKGSSDLEIEFATQIRIAGLPNPETEVKGIVPGRRYRFDFGWRNAKLLVEINGGAWLYKVNKKSGHSTGKGLNRDTEKCNLATLEGWTVLSVTSNQIRDGRALRWVQRALVNGLQRPTM